MEINGKVIQHIENLKVRPTMVIGVGGSQLDYFCLKTHVFGYLEGIGQALDVDVIRNIDFWFKKKIKKRDISVYFPDYILNQYKNKTDEELKLILLNTLEEYFVSHPDWHRVKIQPTDANPA